MIRWWALVRKPILSTLLAGYVLCLFLIMSPPSPVVNSLMALTKPLISWLGTVTSFGIMGPSVFRKNLYYTARIKFADGSVKDWAFPHFQENSTSDWQHQKMAFYFLWQYNLASSENSSTLLRDSAIYIARLFQDPSNEPTLVIIYEHCNETADLQDKIEPLSRPDYVTKVVYEFPVTPEDLQ